MTPRAPFASNQLPFQLSKDQLTIHPKFSLCSPELLERLLTSHYTQTRTLKQNPELLFTMLWILNCFLQPPVSPPNELIRHTLANYPLKDHAFILSNSEGHKRSGAKDIDIFKTAKRLLEDEPLKLLTTFSEEITIPNEDGEAKKINIPTIFTPTSKLNLEEFTTLDSDHKIEVTYDPSKAKKRNTTRKPTTNSKTQTEHKKDKGPVVLFANERPISYTASKNIFLPSDKNFDQLVKKGTEQKKGFLRPNSQTLKDSLLFIDTIVTGYDPEVFSFAEEFELPEGEEPLVQIMKPDLGVRISRNRAREIFSPDKPVGDNKKLVSVLNLLQQKNVRQEQRQEVIYHGLDWVKTVAAHQQGHKFRTYGLTKNFYGSRSNPNGSNLYYALDEQTIVTDYEVLAKASLDPLALDLFDAVAHKRGWTGANLIQQRKKLVDFDYNRGHYSHNNRKGRIWTAISSIPRELRQFVMIDKEETCEIDIKSAHALFVAHTDFFKELPEARQNWLDLVSAPDSDIYKELMEEYDLLDGDPELGLNQEEVRDKFKELFCAFLNGAGDERLQLTYKLSEPFGKVLRKRFPELHQVIKKTLRKKSKGGYTDDDSRKANGMAKLLQEIESSVMGTFFMTESKFLCVSMHDGLLCKKSDTQQLIEAVKTRAFEVLDFPVEVTVKSPPPLPLGPSLAPRNIKRWIPTHLAG